MTQSRKCEVCGGNGGVEQIVLLGTSFVVCAYCRGDAKDTLNHSYIWRRPQPRRASSVFGEVVVFDGGTEIVRRGYGVLDHG